MRQRVMIAMALSCEPKLLIADEPTTALDVTIQAQILELIRQIQEETGAALMLITHDLGVVAEIVDEVMVMYAGRVVEHGSVEEVFLQPRHPYTEGLLASIPSKGMRGQRLNVIRGTVPNPFNMPTGCNFAPRCPYRFEPCTVHDPILGSVDGRDVACWRWQAPDPGGRGCCAGGVACMRTGDRDRSVAPQASDGRRRSWPTRLTRTDGSTRPTRSGSSSRSGTS